MSVEAEGRHPIPERNWFHSYVLPDGRAIAGSKPLAQLQREADAVFRHGVAGKSVIEVGAWAGYFSFEAEKRGAARVLDRFQKKWRPVFRPKAV